MVTVSVQIDLDELDDEDLLDELSSRGYYISKDRVENFNREDFQMILEMIDRQPDHWEIRRLRDKVLYARHG